MKNEEANSWTQVCSKKTRKTMKSSSRHKTHNESKRSSSDLRYDDYNKFRQLNLLLTKILEEDRSRAMPKNMSIKFTTELNSVNNSGSRVFWKNKLLSRYIFH